MQNTYLYTSYKGVKRLSCSEEVIQKTQFFHWTIRQKGQACSVSHLKLACQDHLSLRFIPMCLLRRKQHRRLAQLCHTRQSELNSQEQFLLNDTLRMEKTVRRTSIPDRDKWATGENERRTEWDTVTNSTDTAHCNSQFFTTLRVASLSVSSSVSLKNAASHRWPLISHSH